MPYSRQSRGRNHPILLPAWICDIGEFRVLNPQWNPDAPAYVATAIPTASTSGDLEAALERFVVTTNQTVPRLGENSARLEFTTRQAGAPTTNWVAYHVASASDATGNVTDGNSWNHGIAGDRTHVEFSQYPLPHGKPWSFANARDFHPRRHGRRKACRS